MNQPTRMSGAVATLACAFTLASAGAAQAKDCTGADGKPRGAKAARATLCLLNKERTTAGLKPLRANKDLRRAAREHSQDMVDNAYFDHNSPIGSTLVARVLATGYISGKQSFEVRENLGWVQGSLATPRSVVNSWLASPGHRANLLAGKMRDAGVGIVKGAPQGGPGATYTVVFGVHHK